MLVIVSYITILSIMHPRVTALPFVKYHQLHPPLLQFRKQCPFPLDKIHTEVLVTNSEFLRCRPEECCHRKKL